MADFSPTSSTIRSTSQPPQVKDSSRSHDGFFTEPWRIFHRAMTDFSQSHDRLFTDPQEEKDEWVNDKGVCRTAPARLGLLTTNHNSFVGKLPPYIWTNRLKFHLSYKIFKLCTFYFIQFSNDFKTNVPFWVTPTYTWDPYENFGVWERCVNRTYQSTSNCKS